ncbi:MAG TPA: hypothetical protein VNR37_00690 [Microbacteriaceae bacterium]|nr:hypothetical protein [Microbacteriaceae bacterium]
MNARTLGIRILAPLGLVGALLLSGCTFMAPTATLIQYDPADGVGADMGDVLLRNVQVVTNEDGSLGNIAFTVINKGEATQLNYSVPTLTGTVEDWIPVPPGSTLVGEELPHLIIIEEPDAIVGGLLAVTFQAGDGDSQTLMTPVLDNQGRPYLDPLVP